MRILNRYLSVVGRLGGLWTRRHLYYELSLASFRIIMNEGWRSFWFKARPWLRLTLRGSGGDAAYERWIVQNEPNKEQLHKALDSYRDEITSFQYRPTISIVTPVWNTPENWLRLAIESVINQVYDNWELCIADGASTKLHVREILEEYTERDSRIKVKFLPQNKGISGNSNEALSLATGEFVGFLDHDDELSPFALYEVAKSLNKDASYDFIYSDEDRIDVKGRRFLPFFKPDWSPDLLFSFMYTCHFTVYRRQLVQDCGEFRSAYDFSQDYDLALRVSEKTKNIGHIPKILYHWRTAQGSAAAGEKEFARASNMRAVTDALKRRGYDATVVMIDPRWSNRVKFTLLEHSLISVIIPTDDKKSAIACVNSVLKKTVYPRFELIVVANSNLSDILAQNYAYEPRLRTIRIDRPFNFSARRNLGAVSSKGDYFLFLNDDVIAIEENWLEEMVQFFQRPEVGAVGPKIVYPDNRIQCAGLVTGVRGLISTPFHFHRKDSPLYFQYIQRARNVSALSAACLLVPRQIFESVGGFDEVNTPIMHSDVDLCFRIREKGYLLVYTPSATLKHLYPAGLGNGQQAQPRDTADLYLLKRWPTLVANDPYHTQNMRDYLGDPSWFHRLVVNEKLQLDYSGKNILIMTRDLSLNEANMSAYQLAAYLVDKGNFVTILSPEEGDLIHKFKEKGIPIMVNPSIFREPLGQEIRFVASYDLIITGTMSLWRLIFTCKNKGVPVVLCVNDFDLREQILKGVLNSAQVFNIVDAIVFPSQSIASQYRDFGNRGNFDVIYWGDSSSDCEGIGYCDCVDEYGIRFVEMIRRRLAIDLVKEEKGEIGHKRR